MMGKVIYRGYAKESDPIYTGRYIISNPKVNLKKKEKEIINEKKNKLIILKRQRKNLLRSCEIKV